MVITCCKNLDDLPGHSRRIGNIQETTKKAVGTHKTAASTFAHSLIQVQSLVGVRLAGIYHTGQQRHTELESQIINYSGLGQA